jgi:transposase
MSVAIREKMDATKDTKVYKRLQVVLFLSQGKESGEVAELTGFCEKTVRNFGLAFHEKGLDNFGIDGRKGGNNRLLTNEEAAEFLDAFVKDAVAGHILTVEQMSEAYDAKVGITHKSFSTFYRLIHRMGWRKIKPRSRHPKKASDEAIEASKKLTIL